jgi:general secretion pathway protein G
MAMKRKARKAFTLVEILIVVIILGILAAIVIPQFTEASAEARISNLMTNLQTVRSQLLLYKTQHVEQYPGSTSDAALFGEQMTKYTDVYGAVVSAPDSAHPLGPYLQAVPNNPISGLNTVEVINSASTVFAAPSADGGWWFNQATGEFRANLRDTWVTSSGVILNTL